ncbi:MAG: hypothetical protein JWQ27_1173 [Ferruginibacter sp.]|nr:hypothetical protein [Ferruginibacter sp.]
MKVLLKILVGILFTQTIVAQPVFKDATKANRDKLYRNLVKNTITQNLSYPLTDSTEDYWQDAFQAMELIHYKSPWIESRIDLAMTDLTQRSPAFQRALLEMAYSEFGNKYYTPVKLLLMQTSVPKIFAMSAIYLLHTVNGPADNNFLAVKTKQLLEANKENPILEQLLFELSQQNKKMAIPSLQPFFDKDYLPGNVLMFSFQRSNRDYPGLVLIRDAGGNFIKSDSTYFSVSQLARSNSNMPGFLTNGNTPEGILRMEGFDQSKSSFIGPTTNVQLTMPFEMNAAHFYRDSTITDTTWDIHYYKDLLPQSFKTYTPLYQSFYAGKAGRSEIIAHGTTVNPEYYFGRPYYPYTPTQGCLCTKEIWSEENGIRLVSDQQKLTDAITAAGGPHGYTIVINIDDQERPVSISDILPFLNKAER